MKKTRSTLLALMRAVADECDRNAPFRNEIEEALGIGLVQKPKPLTDEKRKVAPHRRARALVDPILAAKDGEAAVRNALSPLDIEQLKDVVAEFGMDQSKLVMKWKDSERILNKIVEISIQRAAKGEAFRQ